MFNVLLHKFFHLSFELFLHFFLESIPSTKSLAAVSSFLHFLLIESYLDLGCEYCKEGFVFSDRLFVSESFRHLSSQERILKEAVALTFLEIWRGLAHDDAEVLNRDHHLPIVVDLLEVFNAHEIVVIHHGGEHGDGVFTPLHHTADTGLGI